MASAADRLKLFKTLLAQARERLGLDLGFVLWDGSTRAGRPAAPTRSPSSSPTRARSPAMIRRPKPDTLSNLWVAKRIDIRNGTLFDLADVRPREKVRTKDFVKRINKLGLLKLVGAVLARRRGGPWPLDDDPEREALERRPGREQEEHPLPLRRVERLLRALARPRDGLHLRLLHRLGRTTSTGCSRTSSR